MIKRYLIGDPIDTEAVVQEIPVSEGTMAGWEMDEANKSFTRVLAEEDVVFGLGETVRGMNKRGWLYITDNADDPSHTEDKHGLYASHNFLMILGGGQAYGIFVDAPGKIRFDVGYTRLDALTIAFEDLAANIYVIEGTDPLAVVHEFRQLIGRSYIPPKWAFGYGQSRWSYLTEDEVRDVVNTYRQANIPIDSVYLDIDYMERYKDFTVNEETFPALGEFADEMRADGVHLVPIIDAGVKIEDGYDVYEEGVANGYFCKKENGENLVAAVWPGKVHFPDFLNEEARTWFGDKYKVLLDQGIDGFWNDMNEPAIFYTEDHLQEVFGALDSYKGKNLDIRSFFAFRDLVSNISNHPDDYRRFYHEYHGSRIRHDKVHNLYGYYMTRAAGESFRRNVPDKRILMFSRASYIGMHRYGGVWTGDNKSWWSHVQLSLQQMPGLNMCGFLYSGSDIGGFGADCTEDLMLRWLEMAIMTPLYRNHAAMGTRLQELYRFQHLDWFRNVVNLRYALIPYIYSEFMKAALGDSMYMMPLAFVYPDDPAAVTVEDQLLVGESVMLAPVMQQNANGRYVYLPEAMKMLRFRAYDDYDEEMLEAGYHHVSVRLDETLLFLRRGHVLPLAQPAKDVEHIDYSTLRYITFDADPATYQLYNDDGISPLTE